MDNIKVYTAPDSHKPKVPVIVNDMGEVYRRRKGKADIPHRHDFYTILLIKSATGMHIIDFNVYRLGTYQVFFVSPGQIHQVIEKEPTEGWAITVTKAFLEEHHIDTAFISEINLFRESGDTPPLHVEPSVYDELETIVHQIMKCEERHAKFSWDAVGAYLKLFLITANNVCTLPQNPHQQKSSAQVILREFKALVEANYTKEHKVNYYAERLAITPDHLNKTIHALVGNTAKEYIQNRLLLEAKRLLIHSALTAKEIAYVVGFKEPSHFSNFFKRNTGMSIKDFKQYAIKEGG
ncbi:helix-turn-helix transcriptional regulator [Limibacter armeniacum]|uniref:helix-turn-helix domain-containing protein n=1 Tax=Limibacter armeniacum TaxID=466084 RepID=UPI002FE601E6